MFTGEDLSQRRVDVRTVSRQAPQVPVPIQDESGGLRRGRLAVLNDRQEILGNGNTATFTFQVPAVKSAYIVEATYSVCNSNKNPGGFIDECNIVIESFSFQRAGTTEHANIVLDGQPTIEEWFGKGILPRLFTRILELNPHHVIEIRVKNSNPDPATVSISLWIETTNV